MERTSGMTPPPPVTPLQPHRGQHAGIVAVGLLAATTAFVWISHRGKETAAVAADAKPRPAAAVAPVPAESMTLAPIELSAGVGTWAVAERDIQRVVGATAPVGYDEHRTHHVQIPVAGWFEKTRASLKGKTVRAGETIGVVYSPEVYLTTMSLLAELRDFRGQQYVDAERIRLLRWGMRQEQVTRIEKSMKPSAELPIIARATGKVVFEQGKVKQLIDPSFGEVFTITDPTYATIYIDIPAADADALSLGAAARVTLAGTKAARSATVGYISRSVDRGQKTVRADLHPWSGTMPPTEQAAVELGRVSARGLAVPEAAVTRIDNRDVVYVVRADDEMADPRVVTLGAADGGFVLVSSGLAAGETVALPRK